MSRLERFLDENFPLPPTAELELWLGPIDADEMEEHGAWIAFRLIARTRTSASPLNRLSPFLRSHPPVRCRSTAEATEKVVAALLREGAGPGVLALLTVAGDGHVREAAVRTLARVSESDAVPFLLVRRNDWVRQVREAAAEALDACLRPEHALRFLGAIELVERLAESGRDEHGTFVAAVRALLRSEPSTRPALLAGLASSDTRFRRRCFRALTEGVDAWPDGLSRAAAASPDAALRLAAVRALAPRFDEPTFADVAAKLLADPFGPVAAQALLALDERRPADVDARLDAAFVDRRTIVRETARFLLKRRGQDDFAARCRALLDGPTPPLGAVAGLAETGDVSDAARVEPLLVHPSPRMRRTALRAWIALAKDGDGAVLVRALADPSPAVSRAALGAPASRFPFARCAALVREGAAPHVRVNALDIVARSSYWAAGPVLVRTCASDDPDVHAAARRHVHVWSRRASPPPAPPGALDDLRAALEAAGRSLHPVDLATLRWIARA